MPLYEYECDACGRRFERIQKFSDPPIADCPTCGGAVRKLLSSPAIQFKGSGFYITDYAKSGSGSGDSDKKPGDAAKAGAGDGGESKSTSAASSTSSGDGKSNGGAPKTEPAKSAAGSNSSSS